MHRTGRVKCFFEKNGLNRALYNLDQLGWSTLTITVTCNSKDLISNQVGLNPFWEVFNKSRWDQCKMQHSIDYSCTVSSSVQLGNRPSQDPHVTYMNNVSVNSFLLYNYLLRYQSWVTCVLSRFISNFGWKINECLFRIWV